MADERLDGRASDADLDAHFKGEECGTRRGEGLPARDYRDCMG